MLTTQLCRYRYDALDQLIGCEPAGQVELQRFYRREHLVTELEGQASSQHVFQHGKQLLALQSHLGDALNSQLLATDQRRSVLQLVDCAGSVHQVYAPYGHRHAETGVGSLLGYNGEVVDPVTGHYLLGNGLRAFNSVLMRFNSPDTLSPFYRGGLNAYAYCKGDPVNFRDPTGRVAEQDWQPWLILGMSGLGLVSGGVGLFSTGLSIVNSKIITASVSAPLTKIARYTGMAGAVTGLIGGAAGVARSTLLATDPDNSALDPLLITLSAFSALSFAASASSVTYNFRAYKMNRAEAVRAAYSGVKPGNFKNLKSRIFEPSAPPPTPTTTTPFAPASISRRIDPAASTRGIKRTFDEMSSDSAEFDVKRNRLVARRSSDIRNP
jgi:RHS repeat-associated protein